MKNDDNLAQVATTSEVVSSELLASCDFSTGELSCKIPGSLLHRDS